MARDHPIDWAADYRFTSALPTQVLKHLAPMLQQALDRPPGGDVPAGEALDTAPVPATAQPDALAPE